MNSKVIFVLVLFANYNESNNVLQAALEMNIL